MGELLCVHPEGAGKFAAPAACFAPTAREEEQVKTQTCALFMRMIRFLRFHFFAAEVKSDPATIYPIRTRPLALYTRTEVHKFLVLALYHRSIILAFALITMGSMLCNCYVSLSGLQTYRRTKSFDSHATEYFCGLCCFSSRD